MPSEVTRPTKAPHVSFSQVQLAAQCGEAYRRKYVENDVVVNENLPGMAGSAFHKAVERWETGFFRDERLRSPDFDWQTQVEMLTIMTKKVLLTKVEEFDELYPDKEITHYGGQDLHHWQTEKIEGLAQTYLDYRQLEMERGWDWFGDEPSDMLEVEVRTEVGGYPFLAYVDMIYRDSKDRLALRDLKTGETKSFHTMQLEQYRLAVSRALGIEADYGQLLYVKRSKPYLQVVKWELGDADIDEMSRRLRANMEGNTLMVNGPFTGHCTVCEYRPSCPWGDVTPHGSS